ncbi:MAG: DUF1127 domain-containing protein [Pseudomonadota bacterium]
MAMIDTPRTAPFGAITTFQATTFLMNAVEAAKSAVSKRIEIYRTADQLARLSPAMLDDIGITPADVDSYRLRAGLL